MPDRDYSHRAVTDKLGLRPGHVVRVVGQGDRYLLTQVREKIGGRLAGDKQIADVVLYWPKSAAEIPTRLGQLRSQIVPNGGIWVITAKRGCVSSNGMAYFNQDLLIPLGAEVGLVDNKTCSLSERESAMRFVIRRKDRRKWRIPE